MLLDVNLLLLAVDRSSHHHERARTWLTRQLNGKRRVGIPWPTLTGFLRIVTHPRALQHPLGPREAMGFVDAWLSLDLVWIPQPGPSHAELIGALVAEHDLRGNLIPDAHLAALALEHGLTVCSTDTDFARFGEVSWQNPISN